MSLVNLAQVKGTETLKNDVQKMLTSYDALKQTCEANKAYVDKKVADLVNGAPEQLDTLQELSKALNNDKDYATTVNNALAEKLGKREKAASAVTADSANTLEGVPLSHGGDSTFGKIPVVGDDGLLEIGKYIDFHSKNGDKKDYSTRIEANDDGTLSFSGGINANLNGTASSANSVPWAGVTNKPSTYPPSAHTHGLINSDFTALVGGDEDDTWGAIGINTVGHVLKSIRVNEEAPDWLLPSYSSGIAFGGEDTRGVISVSYYVPKVKFAGGNGNKPNWYYSLLGTSGKAYNLDNYLPLSGGAMEGNIHKSTNDTALLLYGGKDFDNGSELALYGKDLLSTNDRYPGGFRLTARNGTQNCPLLGSPDGRLLWNNIDLAGAGIVSQQLESNGYIKYGNGLAIIWGKVDYHVSKWENSLADATNKQYEYFKSEALPVTVNSIYRAYVSATDIIGKGYGEHASVYSTSGSYISVTMHTIKPVTGNIQVNYFLIGSWK